MKARRKYTREFKLAVISEVEVRRRVTSAEGEIQNQPAVRLINRGYIPFGK